MSYSGWLWPTSQQFYDAHGGDSSEKKKEGMSGANDQAQLAACSSHVAKTGLLSIGKRLPTLS